MKVDFKTNMTNFLVEPFYMKTKIVEEFCEETKTGTDATILTTSEIEEIKQRMGSDNQIKILFEPNKEYYQALNFKALSDIEKYYIISDYDENDHSIYLTRDDDSDDSDGVWLPVIFIREFWDFYSNYDHTIKEEETETVKTDIEIIADNLIEYIDKIQDIITNFTNMGLPKEDISFIIQKAILSWTENQKKGTQKWTIRN